MRALVHFKYTSHDLCWLLLLLPPARGSPVRVATCVLVAMPQPASHPEGGGGADNAVQPADIVLSCLQSRLGR